VIRFRFRPASARDPVRNQALVAVFNPHTTGSGIKGWDLVVIPIWGLASLLIAIHLFRWTPTSD
jgi:hypothetical protein